MGKALQKDLERNVLLKCRNPPSLPEDTVVPHVLLRARTLLRQGWESAAWRE